MVIRDINAIIGFLSVVSPDYKGRMFDEMLEWDDLHLEHCHDQVQQIFPLHEESKHANTYPIVSKELITKVAENKEMLDKIQSNLLKAKDGFEKFFAIGDHDDPNIQRKWCRDYNHNLLRVTRIIRCLRLFGLSNAAKDFHSKVTKVGDRLGISASTLKYWDRALNEGIWETLQ